MKIIVITGGIATGKSTIVDYLKNKGFPVIDTDLISRQIVEPGQKCLEDIADKFGQELIKPDGSLDRASLGEIIFNDENKRLELNSIMHPEIARLVNEELIQINDSWDGLVFVDIPLYYEVDFPLECDDVWLVYTDPQTQLSRLMKRNNYSQEEAQSRINSQLPIEIKAQKATTIIDNSNSRAESFSRVDKLIDKLVKKDSKML